MAFPPDVPLRTLIVDDEPAARGVLRRDLGGIDGVEIVGEAENGDRAQRRIAALEPDLVLLDIQMPVKDGFAVARGIEGQLPAIVFVTAYSEHALRTFEFGAADYLLKPFSAARLAEAVERARRSPRLHAERVAQRSTRTPPAPSAQPRSSPATDTTSCCWTSTACTPSAPQARSFGS